MELIELKATTFRDLMCLEDWMLEDIAELGNAMGGEQLNPPKLFRAMVFNGKIPKSWEWKLNKIIPILQRVDERM